MTNNRKMTLRYAIKKMGIDVEGRQGIR